MSHDTALLEPELRTIDDACNNCGGRDRTCIGAGPDFEYHTTEEEFPVVRCESCGLVALNPRPDVSELPKIYPDDYLAYNLSETDQRDADSLACRLRRRYYVGKLRHALGFLKRDTKAPVDFLDVGAGDGRLLNWYRAIPDCEIRTHAVEMNPAAAGILRGQGHTVYEGLFETTPVPEAAFDAVHSSHVIEHVADPKAFADKGRRLLRPGGVLLTETPNLDCVGARMFRRRYWGGYHFPRHWTFYTPETLTDALTQVGLEVVDVRFYPNPVFWVWTMHHLLRDKGFPRFIWSQFPAVDIFKNSFGNVIRLGVFTVIERVLSLLSRGRMGSMLVIARRNQPAE